MAWEKLTGLASDGQYDFYFIPGNKDKAYVIGTTDGVAYTRLFKAGWDQTWPVGAISDFHPLKPFIHPKSGYHYVSLKLNGKWKRRGLHQLVMEAVHGPCPPGMEVRHYPVGDKSNNCISNLRYGTKKQNAEDRKAQGTYLHGEDHHLTLYSDDLCYQVFDLRANHHMSQREIGEAIGSDQSYVAMLLRGDFRPYLREQWLKENPGREGDLNFNMSFELKGEKSCHAKITWEKVDALREEYATGKYSQEQLGKKYGIHQTSVSRIVLNKDWVR